MPADWVSVFWYSREFQSVGTKAKRVLRSARIRFREGFDNIVQSFYILVKRTDFERASQILNQELGT